MAGVKAGRVHLQVTLYDPIWQVTLRSCVMEYYDGYNGYTVTVHDLMLENSLC